MFLAFLAFMGAHTGHAADKNFTMSAPAELTESGFLKHLLPRFSLKTQVHIDLVAPGAAADAALGQTGVPVFDGLGQTWHMQIVTPDHPDVARFAEWLGSEIGHRTISAFQVDGVQLFQPPQIVTRLKTGPNAEVDTSAGARISKGLCGRCHVVTLEETMNSIGSTPSFYVLRSLADWDQRFQAFFALNPHPSFTQITDVTPPFSENRPPPIVPLNMTLDDLDAIIAYVESLEPADLGAPLQHQ